MKAFLKEKLDIKQRAFLKNIYKKVMSKVFSGDLNKLALIQESDKWGKHFYTQHYNTHFRSRRKRKLNILEIGVGGYDSPYRGGNSLRMWKHYFPSSNIYGLDIEDKSPLQENRIKIFKGSQVDFQFLDEVVKEIGQIDIIIDDGSHINNHVIQTFEHLFPYLDQNGIYAVEDTQTSYWESYGGTSSDMLNAKTMMNFFKQLIDCPNYQEFLLEEGYTPSYYDKNIIAMHFYHNMIFINKGVNDEGSNLVIDNNTRLKETKFAKRLKKSDLG